MNVNIDTNKSMFLMKKLVQLLFLLSFALVAYRAFSLSFTHDEGVSYKIILGDAVYLRTANHHYLNSYLMRLSLDYFGDSQLALRLPNLLAYIIYLFIWYKILTKSQNWFLVLFGTSIVLLNPLVTDYFSLARGYGLSLGFIMGSIYFLIKKAENANEYLKHTIGVLFFAILAMYSSFATTNFFIAAVILVLLKLGIDYRLFKMTKLQLTLFVLILIGSAIAFWFAFERLTFLQEHNELYFGTNRIEPSINGLFLATTKITTTIGDGMLYLAYLVVIALVLVSFRGKCRSPLSQIALLFLFIIIGHLIELRVFNSLLPVERASIYIFPLINLVVIFGLMELFNKIKSVNLKRGFGLILSSFTLIIVYNFAKSLNINATRTWDFDEHSQFVAEYLESKSNKKERISISNHWLFEPSLNYYFKSREMNITAATREVNDSSQYVYTYMKEINRNDFIAIKEFKELSIGFYERKK